MAKRKATEHERVLDRARRLFALASDNSSPEEADLALSRLQKLMAQHGLQQADLGESQFKVHRVEGNFNEKGQWYIDLAVNAGTLNDCLVFFEHDGRIEFKGYELDVDVSVLTHEYLVSQVERLMKATLTPTERNRKNVANAFLQGAALSITYRVADIIKLRRREDEANREAGSKALIVQKTDNVEAEFMKEDTHTHLFDSRQEISDREEADAANAGIDAGYLVSLNKQVGEDGDTNQLEHSE